MVIYNGRICKKPPTKQTKEIVKQSAHCWEFVFDSQRYMSLYELTLMKLLDTFLGKITSP